MSLPKTPGVLVRDPDALRFSLARLRALQNLRVRFTVDGKQQREVAIQLGNRSAVISSDLTLAFLAYNGPEYSAWEAAVVAAGGTFTTKSKKIAANLLANLRQSSCFSKIRYLLPFLGGNMSAASVPLIDTLSAGTPANTGFADADFSESTGLQLGTGKYLTTAIYADSLNTAAQGGLGTWELNTTRDDVGGTVSNHIIGTTVTSGGSDTHNFSLHLYTSMDVIYWGKNASSEWAAVPPAAPGGFHYGQRYSTSLVRLYHNGIATGSNTNAYTAESLHVAPFAVGRLNNTTSAANEKANSRIALAMFTDGTLTDSEVAALNTVLANYLIAPTGR